MTSRGANPGRVRRRLPAAPGRGWTAGGLLAASLTMLACGDSTGPTIAAIDVTSPIGDRLAVGRAVQLDAVARDAEGNPLSASVTWESSAPDIAPVSSSGQLSGAAAGSVTITASADGASGSLTLEVLAADLDGIGVTLDDAYLLALVDGLTGEVGGRVQTALDRCAAGVTAGDFDTIEQCLADARTEVSTAAGATDEALLASVVLFLDHIERLLAG